MVERTLRQVAFAMGVLALAACAASTPEPVAWDRVIDTGFDTTQVFAGHERLLDGFSEQGEGRDLVAGDRVLLGLHVEGDDRSTTRYVRLTVIDAGTADVQATIEATVYGEALEALGSARFAIRRESLLGELHATCARFAEPGSEQIPDPQGSLFAPGVGGRGSKSAGTLVLAEMVRVLESTALLRELLWDCVSRPGLLALLGSGPSISFGAEFERSRRDVLPFGDRPAYRFPFLIRIAGAPAMRCSVVATDNRAPLSLCGGVLAVHGESLDAHPNRVLIALLAARSKP